MMDRVSYLGVKQKPVRTIELVGPAGAGKTTLSRALTQQSQKIIIGADIELRKPGNLPRFLRTCPSLLPLFLRRRQASRAFSWDELKDMVYLKSWQHVFRQQAARQGAMVLLDHGPIFRLATLHTFGPDRLHEAAAEPWWNAMFKQWATTLDLVIWLDAPDTILETRINTRQQRHVVKGKTTGEVSEFLNHYRRAYTYILQRLTDEGGPLVLQFDTSRTTIEQIIAEFLVVCKESAA